MSIIKSIMSVTITNARGVSENINVGHSEDDEMLRLLVPPKMRDSFLNRFDYKESPVVTIEGSDELYVPCKYLSKIYVLASWNPKTDSTWQKNAEDYLQLVTSCYSFTGSSIHHGDECPAKTRKAFKIPKGHKAIYYLLFDTISVSPIAFMRRHGLLV